MQARRGWEEVFKLTKLKEDLYPRLLYPAKLSFRMEGQIECSPDKIKLKEFIIAKALFEMLKGLHLRKKTWTVKWQQTHKYQQPNLKQKQKQTKQTTRIGTESQKWRSHGGLSVGNGRGRGGKVQRISSINGRYKIDRGRSRIV